LQNAHQPCSCDTGVMWRRWQKETKPAAASTADKTEQAAEFRDTVAEEAGEFRELAHDVHDAAVTLEQTPAPPHPAVDPGRPVHFPPLTTPPDEWHGGHTVEAPGADFADLGLDIVTPLLGTMLAAWAEGSRRAYERFATTHMNTQRQLALELSKFPTTIDPAVSFAPGSYCFMVISPDEKATILPGGKRRAFQRQYQAFERQRRAYLLAPFTARAWATHIRNWPVPSLTPSQADQITAWSGNSSKRRRNRPTIAAIIPSRGKPGAPAPGSDPR
jgi:hypothetical protein